MKIVFVISSIDSKSNGKGGHFHSLLETVKQVSLNHEVIIVNVGIIASEVLLNSKFNVLTIIKPRISIFKVYRELNKIIKKENPDILHSFDHLAFYWVRSIGYFLRIPYCLTKCGGGNPIYYPYSKYLILFSNENKVFFESQRKFKNSHIHLIPNRISAFKNNVRLINKIKNKIKNKHNSSFKFLRISRISNYYKNSALQLIELVKKLRNESVDCCIIFIGVVEENSIIDELKKAGQDYTYFFTDNEFTIDSKSLINLADAVMGTGRSLMEGAAKRKILLCPIKNSSIPLLINSSNFDKAFKYNFSERLCDSTYNEDINYNQIKMMINNKIFQKDLKFFSNNIYKEFFDSKKIAQKNNIVYQSMESQKSISVLDFIIHTLYLLRKIYK